MRDEEASVEVRGVVRDVAQSVGDREGEGARGGPTRPAILGPLRGPAKELTNDRF